MTFLALLAVACAGLFAGAALYVSLAEHPARMSCGPVEALREWAPSYRRAAWLQASLAIAGGVAGIVAGSSGVGRRFLAGGLLLGAAVAWTLVAILGTNRKLLALSPDTADPLEIAALLTRWNRLHAVRTALGLAALLLMLFSPWLH